MWDLATLVKKYFILISAFRTRHSKSFSYEFRMVTDFSSKILITQFSSLVLIVLIPLSQYFNWFATFFNQLFKVWDHSHFSHVTSKYCWFTILPYQLVVIPLNRHQFFFENSDSKYFHKLFKEHWICYYSWICFLSNFLHILLLQRFCQLL